MYKSFVEDVASYLSSECEIKYDSKSYSWVITVGGLNVDICDHDVLATRQRIVRVSCRETASSIFMQDDSKSIAAIIELWIKDM